MVSVMRLLAIGAITLHLMLYLAPSCESVLVEADDAELGRAVVGLAEVAVEAGRAGREHHAPVVVLAQQAPGGLGHEHAAAQVHLKHLVPVVFASSSRTRRRAGCRRC